VNLSDCKVKQGRCVGYHEGNRVWDSWVKVKPPQIGSPGHEPGAYVSPSGQLWRPCGLSYPGLLLVNWEQRRGHSVDWRTLLRMERFGWRWVPDGAKPDYKITRWQDGTHYYLTNAEGDPFPGLPEKFNTAREAEQALDSAFKRGILTP
jgi:hypothetical protein